MSETILFKNDQTITRVRRKNGKIKVRAESGYAQGVNKLCTVKDTGNGFLVKMHSNSPSRDPIYIPLDYAHAEYLLMALLSEYAADETFGRIEMIRRGEDAQ